MFETWKEKTARRTFFHPFFSQLKTRLSATGGTNNDLVTSFFLQGQILNQLKFDNSFARHLFEMVVDHEDILVCLISFYLFHVLVRAKGQKKLQ